MASVLSDKVSVIFVKRILMKFCVQVLQVVPESEARVDDTDLVHCFTLLLANTIQVSTI